MLYVGMDVHWRSTHICILKDGTKDVKRISVKGSWKEVMAALRRELSEPCQIVFEASCGYGTFYDMVAGLKWVRRVVVAHPGKLRLIFADKRKNDRVDAQKLAMLLILDAVPTAYVPDQPVREWRETIEYRQQVVARIVRCKNTIRALLRTQALMAPKGLWTQKGMAWLSLVEMTPMRAVRRDILLDELASHQKHLKRVTTLLDQIGKKNASVLLLRTIPGIGARTAEAIVAYVDDPNRFGKVRSIGTYLGLVPCQDASAGTNRLGHITKNGPATARKLLVEASWQVIRRCPTVRTRFEQMCHGQKERRKIALVGVARHLACCMLSMLQTGEVWRESA